jgi:hypothetical protein
LALLAVLTALSSCSGEKPEVYQQYWRLDVVAGPEGKGQHERLTLFAQADDADGYEDLAELRLYHRQEEVRWQVGADSWSRVQLTGENWVGSRALQPPDGQLIPRGSYRLVLKDRAGEQAEARVFIDPQIRGLTGGELTEKQLPSPPGEDRDAFYFPFSQGYLILLNAEQQPLRAVPAEMLSTTQGDGAAGEQRWKEEGARFFLLTSYSQRLGFGVERGPYPMTRLGVSAEERAQD